MYITIEGRSMRDANHDTGLEFLISRHRQEHTAKCRCSFKFSAI